MIQKHIINTIKILATCSLCVSSAEAATTFQTDSNSVATATWETWTWQGTVNGGGFSGIALPGQSGNQGSANLSSNGLSFTNSSVTTEILNDYSKPPGGLLGGGDSYYIHDGGFQWIASITTDSNFDFVRFSYSLLGFGGNPANEFDMISSVDGGIRIGQGQYQDANGRSIFFYDFAMSSPTNTAAFSFGDDVNKGVFEGSFRSLDAIQVETFVGSAPSSIPEPTCSLLFGVLGLIFSFQRRRS